jgi:hypothetical protein
MNETMSLLLVATVLAIGGAGLYMYKFDDDFGHDNGNEVSDRYNEEDFNEEDFNEEDFDENAYDEEIIKPRAKTRGGKTKTKRNRTNSGSKRRY